jgi:hypothetical protein
MGHTVCKNNESVIFIGLIKRLHNGRKICAPTSANIKRFTCMSEGNRRTFKFSVKLNDIYGLDAIFDYGRRPRSYNV